MAAPRGMALLLCACASLLALAQARGVQYSCTGTSYYSYNTYITQREYSDSFCAGGLSNAVKTNTLRCSQISASDSAKLRADTGKSSCASYCTSISYSAYKCYSSSGLYGSSSTYGYTTTGAEGAMGMSVVLVFLFGPIVCICGGIYCCIQSKQKAGLGAPKMEAYIASAVLLVVGLGIVMWVPFIMDSCYQGYQGGQGGFGQQTVVTTQTYGQQQPMGYGQQQMQMQPMQAQAQVMPVQAMAVQAVAMPIQAQAMPPTYGQAPAAGAPVVAVATVMP